MKREKAHLDYLSVTASIPGNIRTHKDAKNKINEISSSLDRIQLLSEDMTFKKAREYAFAATDKILNRAFGGNYEEYDPDEYYSLRLNYINLARKEINPKSDKITSIPTKHFSILNYMNEEEKRDFKFENPD